MNTAVWLMRAGAALTVVQTVVNLAIDHQGGSPYFNSSTHGDRAAEVGAFVGALFGAGLFVAIWLWMAWANGKGKPWARVVATVIAILNAALAVPGLVIVTTVDSLDVYSSGAAKVLALVFQIAVIGVGLAAVWLMYRPESTAFYAVHELPPYPPPYPAYRHYPPNGPYGWQPPHAGGHPGGSAPPPPSQGDSQ